MATTQLTASQLAAAQELKARITLRLESIQKNKTLSGLAKRNNENFQDIFTSVYNAILGEYFITKFNKVYNPAPTSNQPQKSKKECVLDYLDSQSLEHYLDCVQEVIDDILANGCTIKQALHKITPKTKILFANLSVNSLRSSIEKDVKKHQRQIKKGLVKNNASVKPMATPKNNPVTLQSQPVSTLSKEEWAILKAKHDKETYDDYCIPDEEYEID